MSDNDFVDASMVDFSESLRVPVERAEPLHVDDTDYLSLFWSGKDALNLSRSLNDTSVVSGAAESSIKGSALPRGKGGSKQPPPGPKAGKKAMAKLPVVNPAARRAPPPVQQGLLPALPSRQEKQPRVLTAEEMQEKMELLSRPAADRTEEVVVPPLLCTEGPQLSPSCIDELHEHSDPNVFEFERIPSHVHSLRLQVEATVGGSEEWEMTNRQAFPDAFFTRKDNFHCTDTLSESERLELARSTLFSKIDYRKTPRHVMEFKGFMHRYCLGFVCLVFDMRMQVIGTYDLHFGVFLPGILICPQNVNAHNAEQFRRTANLLQIDLSSLPRNVFAVVPVLFDQAGHTLPDLGLSCSLSASDGAEGPWSPLSKRMNKFMGIRKSVDSTEVIATGSAVFTKEFGKGCGYCPFVVFRRSSVEKGWGIKSLNMCIDGAKTSDVVSEAMRGLSAAGVLPYHVVYIEHCCDCDKHAMTTWHIPGSYEKRCAEVKRAMRDYIPPSLVYSNILRRPHGDEKKTTDGMARIGAFEVTVRPYYSSFSMRVFSKLNQKVLPQPSDITDICSSLLLPDRLQYSRKRTVHLYLFDSYYKTLTKDARVVLFKLNTHHNITSESLESLVDLKEVQTCTHTSSGGHLAGAADDGAAVQDATVPPPRSVVVSGRSRLMSAGSPKKMGTRPKSPNRDRAAHDSRRLPPKKFTSSDEKKATFSEELMKSEAIQDCVFRHSVAYYRVRCWSQQEVDQWLKSHGVSDQAISNAHASGVEDGASLLALGNKMTFRKWGVRAQLTLRKLESSLSAIRSGAADYDPCVVEALPEDGQERRGYSRASPDYLPGRGSKNPYFEQFAVSNVSADGSIQFDVNLAGTYMIMATSPSISTFCSHAFSFGSNMHYNYAALLKPLTVPVYFRILMEDANSALLDGVPFANTGLLYSVVNMTCGKRHTGFANFEEIFEEAIAEGGEDVSVPSPPKQKIKTPKLQRFNSIVDILSASPTSASMARSQSTGTLGGGGLSGGKTFARAKKKIEPKKTLQRVIVSLIWLPVGKYYSEVDGSVFTVEDKEHTRIIRETAPGDVVSRLALPPDTPVSDRLVFGGEVLQPAVVKCHLRLVKSSIRGFQMIYRRYKKTFLFDKMCAYMVMRRGAKRFCDWAREEVRKKKIVKVQSWLRMTRVLREYRSFWSSTVFIQSRLRILLARFRIKKLKKAQRVLYVAMIVWYARHKRKQHNAALAIQMMYRRSAAIKKKDCLIFARRCKKLFVRYIGRIKAKIRMANAAKLARRREQDECLAMASEESHVLMHLQWLKAEQRKRIELRLEAIAKKKDAAATRIQAMCRGPLLRSRLQKGVHAVIRLQRIHRVKTFIRRTESGQHLRYLTGFKHLLLHPQLLGATMQLLGIWSGPVILPVQETIPRRSPGKPKKYEYSPERPLTEPAQQRKALLGAAFGQESGLGGEEECGYEQLDEPIFDERPEVSVAVQAEFVPDRPSQLFGTYSKYLNRPAIKIQSMFRMANHRFRYIAAQNRSRGRRPPLYRHLKAVREASPQKPNFIFPVPAVQTAPTASLGEDAVKAQAAVKLQAAARRFSVRLRVPSSKSMLMPLSTKCNQPLSPRVDETPASADQPAENINNDDEFFPGYYDEKGTYIYYQSDGGEDYFGYYDDDGTYLYCEGDITRVMFVSPNVAKGTGRANELEPGPNEPSDSPEQPIQPEVDDEDSLQDSKSPSRFSLVRSDQNVSVKEAFKSERSVKFKDDKAASENDDADELHEHGSEIDEFVNAHDDFSEDKITSPRNTDNKDNTEKTLRRPWSFISEMSEDNTVKPDNSKLPRVRSFASGLTGATDMTGIRSLSESVKDVFTATTKAISLKGSSLKHKAGLISGELSNNITVATQQMKTTAEKTRAEKERLLRIKNHKFQVEDAVLTVRGTAMPDIPRLNRQWFIGVFPHTTDFLSDEGEDKTEHVRERERDQQEYEMRHGRYIGEATRSAMLYPLSKESFQKLNFSLHLADLPRYVVVDICLFVEADEGALVRPDYLPSNVSVPSAEHKTVTKDMATKTWLPAFRGEFRLDEGAVFGPCGGKVNVLMRPNLSEAIYLSRAQARRLAVLEGLCVSVALQPVAVPSMEFLLSLRDDTPTPFLPGHTIDAVLLQKYTSSYTFNGAAVCAVSFQDRMLVSARHKGAPLGLLEFNKNGECIGRITSHLETLKTVVNMVVGAKHVLLCTNGGLMGMIRRRKSGEMWSSPSYIDLHESTVIMGIAMHRAGIDFFFTVDKYCNIGVTIYEDSRLLKSYLNSAFANSTICSISACCNSLYLGQTDGILLVLDVTDLIDGDFKIGSALKEKIIYCGEIFGNKTSITSLGVLATNSYFSLPTEDPPPGRRAKESAPQSVKKSSKVRSDGFSGTNILNSAFYGGGENTSSTDAKLEGHLILVGGGDGDPRVRIMRVVRVVPKGIDAVELNRNDGKAEPYTTIQEIAILRGHTRAVSAIIVDAAGRFIITASKEESMFLVWDAFTFTCEKLYDDVEIGTIHGGMNCLFVCSFKPPYLSMYTVPQERREGWESNAAVTNDGRPEIGMVRTNLWCTASVKGGVAIPSKSMVRATQFLGEKGRSIVEMWQKYHNHASNEEYRGGASNATPSGQSAMSKDLRSVKSMTLSESHGAIRSRPVMSSKNYIPPPSSSGKFGGSVSDPVWGGGDNQQEDASVVSEDQWGENAPVREDPADSDSGRSAVSADVAAEECEDEPLSRGQRNNRSRLVGNDSDDDNAAEDYGDNTYNYPDGNISTVVGKDPFAGKISHKMNLTSASYRDADVTSIRPNRLKRYDSDGVEVSLAPNRKAHFSDSDSENEGNNIIIARPRKQVAEDTDYLGYEENSHHDWLGNPGYHDADPSYRAARRPRRGVIQELKDVESSGSDSD